MATLPSYFSKALSNIEPGVDADNAKEAHRLVRSALEASTELKDLGIDTILIGSYAREVSIRRVKDVDVFGRLEMADTSLPPKRALDLFEMALADEFGEELVERQFRSIKVDFPDFDLSVDAVPARRSGGHWEIPEKSEDDEPAAWIATNPLKLNDLSTQANKDFTLNDKGVYVPTVKLIRQIRRTWCGDQPGGLYFEILTYWAFENGKPSAASHAEYLVKAMEHVNAALPAARRDGLEDPTLPGETISTKATDEEWVTATAGFAEATALAQKALYEPEDCLSAVKWQRLLGKNSENKVVFELPEYCDADGNRKRVGVVITGARTSPKGTGRYA